MARARRSACWPKCSPPASTPIAAGVTTSVLRSNGKLQIGRPICWAFPRHRRGYSSPGHPQQTTWPCWWRAAIRPITAFGSTGLAETGTQFVVYASAEAHGCINTAVEISGIGSNQLRLIPADSQGRIRLDLLKSAITADREAGRLPLLVVGTAGTVNFGAFDDLTSLAAICRAENLWFHVDGAFGALCALTPSLRPLVSGIEKAELRCL